MAESLKFIKGPLKGKAVLLTRSITLGREGTDIATNDPKLSKIHAFIKKKSNGTWVIEDNNSRNGIFVEGKKIREVKLTHGLKISLGNSEILVDFREEKPPQNITPFSDWMREASRSVPNENIEMREIRPTLKLKFIAGEQYGEVWRVFYAPRVAGSECLDLEFMDRRLPAKVFTLESVDKAPFIKTDRPDLVMINGKPLERATLKQGDVIEVGDSQLLVEFGDD